VCGLFSNLTLPHQKSIHHSNHSKLLIAYYYTIPIQQQPFNLNFHYVQNETPSGRNHRQHRPRNPPRPTTTTPKRQRRHVGHADQCRFRPTRAERIAIQGLVEKTTIIWDNCRVRFRGFGFVFKDCAVRWELFLSEVLLIGEFFSWWMMICA